LIQEALSLADAQFGPFIIRLKQLQATRRQTQQQAQRLLRTLQQFASRGDTSAGDLEARLQERDEQRTHAAATVRNAHAAVADVRWTSDSASASKPSSAAWNNARWSC